MKKKLVIIGGVAGGASAAARARRLSEEAEIIVLEMGAYVSFANCGLPYHIGGEIQDRSKLLLHTPQSLKERFNLDVRINTEVVEINPESKFITVVNQDGAKEIISYDDLIISTGAAPIKPAIPGINAKGVFTLRDISDMDQIIAWVEEFKINNAIVVGGGFIGVEVAEQLTHKDLKVSLIEGNDHILAPFDSEMVGIIEQELEKKVSLSLGSRLKEIQYDENNIVRGVILDNAEEISGQIVILGLGVKPEIKLAEACGIKIGVRGGIQVDQFLQTSKANIWAIGDVIEVKNFVTKEPSLIALAGPANRQGRAVADNILLDKKKIYEGTLGTAVIRVYSKIAACTGANEKSLNKSGIEYQKLYLFPGSHAGYFPGAKEIALKVLFSVKERKLLGAQAISEDGADKRIDVLATAIKGGLSIDQIADLELCYAPPVGSAKDPINMAGMSMQNVADGLVSVIGPEEIQGYILDVRSRVEVEKSGMISGAINIPIDELSTRHNELPKDQRISIYCQSGQRSYNAARKLMQLGYQAVNVTGAFKAYQLFRKIA